VWNYPASPHLNIAASALDLNTIGPEWVFGGWRAEEKGPSQNIGNTSGSEHG
jgi:hypothetical protein